MRRYKTDWAYIAVLVLNNPVRMISAFAVLDEPEVDIFYFSFDPDHPSTAFLPLEGAK